MDGGQEDAVKLAEEYKICLKTPDPDAGAMQQSSYVFIRHGHSQFNFDLLAAKTKHGEGSPEFKAVQQSKDLHDPDLHAVGVQQCLNHQDVVNAVNWKVVFVSPLIRALQTAIHMFKDHPNKANIKFVTLPIAREVMHTSNDIARDIHDVYARFKPGMPDACGLVIDFSPCFAFGNPSLWQVYTIANAAKQALLMSQVQVTNPDAAPGEYEQTNIRDVMHEEFPKHEPRFEEPVSLLRRAHVLKRFMREYEDRHPLAAGEKYAVVCHSFIISACTAEGLEPSDPKGLKNYIRLENCQLLPFNNY